MQNKNMSEAKKKIDFDSDNNIPADDYENLARKFIPGYDGLYSLTQTFLSIYLPDEADVLIVGAGGGKKILTFGRAFPQMEFVGVDPSEKMLAVAQEKVEKENFSSRVRLHRGTIQDLDAKEFDAATALLVMHFLPDDGEKLNFLKGNAARLKPNARLIIADVCADKSSAEFDFLLRAYLKHAELNETPPEMLEEAPQRIVESLNCVSEKRELELLREAGFGEILPFYQGLWFRGWLAAKL